MMTALFLLALMTGLAIWYGKRRAAFALSLATIGVGLIWFNYHITEPLKLNF